MSNIWAAIFLLLSSFNPLFLTGHLMQPQQVTAQVQSQPQTTKNVHTPVPVNVPSTTPVSKTSTPTSTPVTIVPVKSANNTPASQPATPPASHPTGNSGSQPCVSDPNANKDPCPPDPNRPYYDMWGNKFDYMGNLIWATCPNQPDPISGKDNPYCVCPANTSQGVYFIRGNDKNTNSVVCGFGYYHECPYAEAVSADDPLCQKLGAEAGK